MMFSEKGEIQMRRERALARKLFCFSEFSQLRVKHFGPSPCKEFRQSLRTRGMAGFKSFQEILDEALNTKEQSPAPEQKSSQEKRSQSSSVEDVVSKLFEKIGNIKFSAANTSFGAEYKRQAKAERTHAKSQEPVAASPKAQRQTSQPQPSKLRVKRVFTFDQARAIELISSFGEKLNDFSTDEEIKGAYRRLARKFHPDMNASASPTEKKKAEEIFKKLSSAYQKFDF